MQNKYLIPFSPLVLLCGHLGYFGKGGSRAVLFMLNPPSSRHLPMRFLLSMLRRGGQLRRVINVGLWRLHHLLGDFGELECCDIRDRIFGIISLFAQPTGVPKLEADYSMTPLGVAVQAQRYCEVACQDTSPSPDRCDIAAESLAAIRLENCKAEIISLWQLRTALFHIREETENEYSPQLPPMEKTDIVVGASGELSGLGLVDIW